MSTSLIWTPSLYGQTVEGETQGKDDLNLTATEVDHFINSRGGRNKRPADAG